MGRTIYFSDKEMDALRDTSSELCIYLDEQNQDYPGGVNCE